jgi:hypothetical protein
MGPGVRRDDNWNYFTIPNCRDSHDVSSGSSMIAISDSGTSQAKPT